MQTTRVTSLIFIVFASFVTSAWAYEAQLPVSKKVPCGVLKSFNGQVELLNEDRTGFVPTQVNGEIPCSGWVSVKEGWATLSHRQGFEVKLGPDTFIQIHDHDGKNQTTGDDHFILYRGKVFVEAPQGTHEIRLITANARARASRGAFVFAYNAATDESYIVSLDSKIHFENRFEPSRSIDVAPGESTVLNFKQLRTIPETPQAVKVASLKAHIADLPLTKSQLSNALEAARKRNDRTFASKLDSRKSNRAPASTSKHTYERYKTAPKDDAAKDRWVNRLVGGSAVGEKILFPEKQSEQRSNSGVEVIAEEPTSKKKLEEEKAKLMRELSEIR